MDASQILLADQATSEQTHILQAKNISIGMKFAQPDDLKVAVELFYASQGKGMKVGRGGSRQREFRCSGLMLKEGTRKNVGCHAIIRATKQSDNEWKISSMHAVHENCTGGNHKVSAATAGRIASAIVATTPRVSGKELKAAIESKTGGSLGLRAAYRAKCAALAEGRVGLEESYSRLRPYLAMLATRSPGTVTDLEVEEDNTFRRCFVMLGKAVHIVTNSVPKLFALTVCQLEGVFSGVMMKLSCKDSDSKVVHVAIAIVRGEDDDNYRYLLSNCKRNPMMRDFICSPDTTCFFGGHEGSLEALRTEARHVQYRRCLKRIIDDISGVGDICKEQVIEAARAPTRPLFDKIMCRVKALNAGFHKAMMEVPLEHWTHHASRGDTVILDQVTSGLEDSTTDMDTGRDGSEVEAETRKLPVFELVVQMVQSTSSKFAESENHGLDCNDKYTKFVMDTYRAELDLGKEMNAFPLGNSMYMVQKTTERFNGDRVTLAFDGQAGPLCVCTCTFPARYRIPCRHVFAAAQVVGRVHDCDRFVGSGYRATRYRELHLDQRFPVVCPMVNELHRDPSLKPPRRVHEQPGRPEKAQSRKRRKKSLGESNSSSRRDSSMTAANSGLDRIAASEIGAGLDIGSQRGSASGSSTGFGRIPGHAFSIGDLASVAAMQRRGDSQGSSVS